MKDLISVIIPVYNADKYIQKCIESILVQTYENFELILVDDGSKDNSGKICDEYAKKDSRILVIHKENAGVSSARNTGIERAKGEFIAFVDSDDWLEKNSLGILYREITEQNADLAAGAFVKIKEKGAVKHTFNSGIYIEEKIAVNIIDLIEFFHGTVWAKLFRRDIINEEGLIFNPEIPMGEDTLFLMTYMQFCKKIILNDEVVYNYNCLVEGSAVRKFYEKYDEYFFCVYQAAKGIVEKSNLEENKKRKLVSIVANRYCCSTLYYYMIRNYCDNMLKQKIYRIMERYEGHINKNLLTAAESTITPFSFTLLSKKYIDGFIIAWNIYLLKSHPIVFVRRCIKFILWKMKLIK